MALILAIEPDRRQASQLTAIVRGRLHAELVLAESAERALAALGQRVPDLILTAAFLPPRDESALAERLRALDGSATHVQTLTIPVLASSSGGSRVGGMLSALRRDKSKPASTPDGCEPDVFAEQCQEYLNRAAAERAAMAQRAHEALDDRLHGHTVHMNGESIPSAMTAETFDEYPAHKTAAFTEGAPSTAHRNAAIVSDTDELIASFESNAPFDAHAHEHEHSFASPDTPAVAEHAEPIASYAAQNEPAASDLGAAGSYGFLPAEQSFTELRREPVVAASDVDADDVRRSFFRQSASNTDVPASLLAAVAALEAEEQEALVAPTIDAYPSMAETYTPVEERQTSTIEAYAAEDHSSIDNEIEEPPSDDIVDLSSIFDEPGAATNGQRVADEEPSVEVYDLGSAFFNEQSIEADLASTPVPSPSAPTPQNEFRWPALNDIAIAADATAARPATPASTPPQKHHSTTAITAEPKAWLDIIEALRRDAAQLQTPPAPIEAASPEADRQPEPAPSPAEGPTVAHAQDASHTDSLRKRRKRANGGPAQDEWGFFDPDQCGFAALIEKLEEITDAEGTPVRRRESS